MTPTFKGMWLLLIALACNAQAKDPDADFCRNGLFPREQEHVSLGVVQGEKHQQVHFFDDSDGCPFKGATCMGAAYLVPGDEVVVGKTSGDWACVWYQGPKHEFVSWVPAKHIATLPAPPLHPVRDWVGTWSDGNAQIRIAATAGHGGLALSSTLRWHGGVSSTGESVVHYGGTKAPLEVQGRRAIASDGVCQVVLTRIGEYLLADDNGDCGGLNVRHTGVYFRHRR